MLWVNWNVVCYPIEKGGLGIKNLELFNEALLGKLLRRLLSGEKCLWRDMFMEKFGISNLEGLVRVCYEKKRVPIMV